MKINLSKKCILYIIIILKSSAIKRLHEIVLFYINAGTSYFNFQQVNIISLEQVIYVLVLKQSRLQIHDMIIQSTT